MFIAARASAKPVSELLCRSGAHTPPQALRALVQCMTGTKHDPTIVSGRSDAAAGGVQVWSAMPRVVPRIVG